MITLRCKTNEEKINIKLVETSVKPGQQKAIL